jgi:hypothetical protein
MVDFSKFPSLGSRSSVTGVAEEEKEEHGHQRRCNLSNLNHKGLSIFHINKVST